MRSNADDTTPSSRCTTPFWMRSSKNAMSSPRSSSRARKMYRTKSSARSALSARSAKATSGSIIQNSARWREVLEFSARKVGPKVYTLESASQYASTLSCPDTVRLAPVPKKSCEKSTSPPGVRGRFTRSSVETRNICPAPSASLVVMMGVCTQKKRRSW
jgi:hypothetical protein